MAKKTKPTLPIITKPAPKGTKKGKGC